MPFENIIAGNPRVGRALTRLASLLSRIWPTMFAFQFLVVCEPLPGVSQVLSASEPRYVGARAASITYDVAANWKAVVENYSECLHCPGVHPELNRLSHYESGDEHFGPGLWCGGTMTLNDGAATMASGGGHLTRPPIAGIEGEALREVIYYALFPNCLTSPAMERRRSVKAATRR